MKKKIVCIMIYLLIIGCFFQVSYATKTGTVFIQSNLEMIEQGEEVEITVKLKDAKTVACNFSLYFDELKFDYISDLENTNVVGNRILFVWYDSAGGKDAKEGEIAKFKFKAKEKGLATFNVQGEFYSQTGQLIKTDFEEKQIQIGKEESILQMQAEEEEGTDPSKSNATLQALRLNREGIIPVFKKDVYEYYLTVPNDVNNLEVLAISENPNANIQISGNTNLKEGLNTIKIKVTSEDKTQEKEYTIQVTKTANLELANTNLEILAIENTLLNPPFDTSETNYSVQVSKNTENLKILAIPQNENASVEISGKDKLKLGNNLVTIIVTAPNGISKKKYQVQVYKRNQEEEEQYNKEQEEMKEQLEHAYEIEKISSDSQNSVSIEESKTYQNGIIWIVTIGIVTIALGGVGFWYVKRKRHL